MFRVIRKGRFLLAAVCAAVLFPPHARVSRNADPAPHLQGAYGDLPLRFESNLGQAAAPVKFLSRGRRYVFSLTPTEAVFVFASESRSAASATQTRSSEGSLFQELKTRSPKHESVLRMKLVGANAGARIIGLEELLTRSNYFVGSDPGKWRSSVPNFAKVKYEGVYPGIDLLFYGDSRQLEYDFIVAPGADVGAIRLSFSGAEKLTVDTDGNLVAHTDAGPLMLRAPVIYQQVDQRKQPIRGGYALYGSEQVGFQVAGYDFSKPLVVDPVIVYSTFLGGADRDEPNGIAVDASKNVYVVGTTVSTDFPVLSPIQRTSPPYSDVFVMKLNAAGSAIVYSTYIGGDRAEVAGGIAVDAAGNAYISGRTSSSNFPTVNAFQNSFGGNSDAFVAKLNAAGSGLLYSTYLGSSNFDSGEDIAVDSQGNACVTGSTGGHVFVTKLNSFGSAVVYSLMLGGSSRENGFGIAVDNFGNAYVTGQTTSTDFPTVNAAQGSLRGDCSVGCADAFVAKLNPQGTLLYSTYLGGEGEDLGAAITVDASGSAYVTGFTNSIRFPTTRDSLQSFSGGDIDAFVAKFSPSGALVYSTYLGSLGRDKGNDIAVDAAGAIYVTGFTNSIDFPVFGGPQRSPGGGQFDVFVAKLNAAGSAILYSTYLGGSGIELSPRIAVDAFSNVYVAGLSSSKDFPTVNPLQATNRGGTGDVFVTKISETEQPACTLACAATAPLSARPGAAVSFSASATASFCSGAITFEWNFGDGSLLSSEQNPSHIYAASGAYTWTMTTRTSGAGSCSKTGRIVITFPNRRRP
ncbi:MAG TPA: SBBP repeat-containing protein [Acidobacteriota bacterium]|nr:SBBP repeat-containing protein [Acidobacteriota bacterium]